MSQCPVKVRCHGLTLFCQDDAGHQGQHRLPSISTADAAMTVEVQERAERTERERDEAKPVLEATRGQAVLADKLQRTTDPRERQAVMGDYLIACGRTNVADAARAAGGGGDE